ncbi:PAX3- and PAX7-binding protein 1 isoform X1 [Chironomus tepperi]|uniref:PAX3- and PAX7-binding protein 1 isoform X1 n=2 Tax=Chironomus tepperi TaxID=113505 RepID=UPI00391F2B02
MSLFKKPKKSVLNRRIFSSENDPENAEKMDMDEDSRESRKDSSTKDKKLTIKPQKSSLLSFGDEDEGETFQVKKSSYSRKIHKERKKEKNRSSEKSIKINSNNSQNSNNNSQRENITSNVTKESNYVKEIQSESDGFSIRLKNSNPDNLILNGRAALCAGRDEMSSEEENEENEKDRYQSHKFSQPDEIKLKLESGAIPDAAMIHAARKRRQKAREEGEFISIDDDQEQIRKGKRNVREEDVEGSGTDEERVDMSAITGVKEREERREQFYSVQSDEHEHDDSDIEMNEWENQQIRKGVTGAQIMTAQSESTLSQYLLPPLLNSNKAIKNEDKPELTTAELLEQAYSQNNYEMAKQIKKEKNKEVTKSAGIKTPQEILKIINDKLKSSRELNHKHYLDIDRITEEFSSIIIDLEESEKNGPQAASKYRFYQELKLYLDDLIECLNEKVPQITALEERILSVTSKYSKKLIERRRQDVRDQAKEITDTKTSKKTQEDEERVRRAAEREGRRTRRRREREKLSMNETHNDGMSSDDEVPDIEYNQYKEQISQIKQEAALLFDDVTDEYCELPFILQKFEEWKKKDLNSYKEAFVHLCLPKVIGVFVRWEMILWTPFSTEHYEDIDKMKWYHPAAMYGRTESETEETLRNDPDVFLIPTVIEKYVLPKLNKILEGCFDPLSTTQTLKLVKLLNQLSKDYPSLRITSKNLQALFSIITEKMTIALDNDVFIPIFPKQSSDSKSSAFFQRQFYSGIKLFRNFISFQGIVADSILKNFAISSLLNRYLLSAMRISNPLEGISKAQTLLQTLPRIWLVTADKSFIDSMNLFVIYVGNLEGQLDSKGPLYADSVEKLKQIMARLELMVKT